MSLPCLISSKGFFPFHLAWNLCHGPSRLCFVCTYIFLQTRLLSVSHSSLATQAFLPLEDTKLVFVCLLLSSVRTVSLKTFASLAPDHSSLSSDMTRSECSSLTTSHKQAASSMQSCFITTLLDRLLPESLFICLLSVHQTASVIRTRTYLSCSSENP